MIRVGFGSSTYDIKKISRIRTGDFEYFTMRLLNLRGVKEKFGEEWIKKLEGSTLKEKLSFIFKELVNDESMSNDQGYINLIGIWNDMRSALHHPKRENTISY